MKKIEAVIRPDRLQDVHERLEEVGYPGMMVTEIGGQGLQRGLHANWPRALRVLFLPKIKLEIVVKNQDVSKVCHAILEGARTGEIGDGKIFILNIQEAVRIRTGEKGIRALRPSRKKA